MTPPPGGWLPGPPTPWWIPRWTAGPDGEAHVQLHHKPATLCGRPASRKEHLVTSFCAKCERTVATW